MKNDLKIFSRLVKDFKRTEKIKDNSTDFRGAILDTPELRRLHKINVDSKKKIQQWQQEKKR